MKKDTKKIKKLNSEEQNMDEQYKQLKEKINSNNETLDNIE